MPIQIGCPSCGNKYAAQVQSIVDVSQNPELKSALLRGQLNVVTCPACKTPAMVSAPLLYHDPDKSLLLLFVPPELNLPLTERERLTGQLVNALMSVVPAEKRKGYFLNPRPALTMQGLIDEVLKADGVTQEMLEKQRARSRLIQDLLAVLDTEEQLNALIEQHRAEIDYPFLLTLSATLEGSAVSGPKMLTEQLLKLRELLVARTGIALPEPLPLDTPVAEVLQRSLAFKDKDSLWAFVLYNRPLLDYAFFQELTAYIEKAPKEQADELGKRRSDLLEMTERLDKEAQQVQQAKLQVLRQTLASSDPAKTLRENKQEIDTLFLAMIGAALRSAEKEGKTENVERLKMVNEVALQVLQDSLPPELRLVNDLLSAEYPEGTRQILAQRRKEWNTDFPEILTALAEDVEAQGRPEAAQRLKELRSQAETILQVGGEILTAHS
jgi:hypothetical protein